MSEFDSCVSARGRTRGKYSFVRLEFKCPVFKVRRHVQAKALALSSPNVLLLAQNPKSLDVGDDLSHPLEVFLPPSRDVLKLMEHKSGVFVLARSRSMKFDVVPADTAFHALYRVVDHLYGQNNKRKKKERTKATNILSTCGLMTYFRRNRPSEGWRNWFPFVQCLLSEQLSLGCSRVNSCELICFARWHRRSLRVDDKGKATFDECEVLLTEGDHLGVMYIKGDGYVSPTIVCRQAFDTSEKMTDVNRRVCNAWVGLYCRRSVWLREGLDWYIVDHVSRKAQLTEVLTNLREYDGEKYRRISSDLETVQRLLR